MRKSHQTLPELEELLDDDHFARRSPLVDSVFFREFLVAQVYNCDIDDDDDE